MSDEQETPALAEPAAETAAPVAPPPRWAVLGPHNVVWAVAENAPGPDVRAVLIPAWADPVVLHSRWDGARFETTWHARVAQDGTMLGRAADPSELAHATGMPMTVPIPPDCDLLDQPGKYRWNPDLERWDPRHIQATTDEVKIGLDALLPMVVAMLIEAMAKGAPPPAFCLEWLGELKKTIDFAKLRRNPNASLDDVRRG